MCIRDRSGGLIESDGESQAAVAATTTSQSTTTSTNGAQTSFAITTEPQTLPNDSRCEIYTKNDDSVVSLESSEWVRIVNPQGEEHLWGLESTPGFENTRVVFTPVGVPTFQDGRWVFHSAGSSFETAIVTCEPV